MKTMNNSGKGIPMFELITLGMFIIALAICIAAKIDILYALVFGLFCFNYYCFRQGYSLRNILAMMLEGIAKVKIVLTIFVLIGLLTACWRAGGTIPYIIYHGINYIDPSFYVLGTFLLCCCMSFLLGTCFGTVSTVGVVCMMLSNSAGFDPLLTGGAIMSGIFFGDRGSPMSSTAQLITALTQTNIYNNARLMMKTAVIPFALTCCFYLFFPSETTQGGIDTTVVKSMAQAFDLHWLTILPAALLLTLAMLRFDVRLAMLASIILCCILTVTMQEVTVSKLMDYLLFGFKVEGNKELAEQLNGGGLLSMLRVAIIVTVSSSYSGVFFHTKLLTNVKRVIEKMAGYLLPFGATLVTSVFTGAVACNQTLTVIITEQLCTDLYKDKTKFALALANTAMLVSALIPWNIAGSVSLTTIDAPVQCLFYAVYLYLIPLWNWLLAFWGKE